MQRYVTIFVVAGGVIPIVLHRVAADRMPWWPDTVTLGIGFGASAVAIARKASADRALNGRLWNALKAWGMAIGQHVDTRYR